ncbi:DUF4442 domain-containing protein [Ekhidna sp.]|uniref:DUF4442 domain-containing protein n=1 Tax=Ekhidna sp. TaxID=2608089 RepID=UPI0032982A16
MYQFLSRIANKYFKNHTHKIFKVFFNLTPMYRRSTGRIISVTPDLSRIDIKIPISYKNRNYVGTIFGGSLFSATDPIYMVQLIQLLGTDYVVWDKSSIVNFRRPASTDAYAVFEFTKEDLSQLKKNVAEKKEVDIVKTVSLTSKEGKVFCEIEKTIYIADKAYYKEKRKKKSWKQ